MCRNIKTSSNFEPPATDDEVRASALQFVRKLSGRLQPSRVNQQVFDLSVQRVRRVALELIDELESTAPARRRQP